MVGAFKHGSEVHVFINGGNFITTWTTVGLFRALLYGISHV